MSPTFYHILHVISVLVLTGYTFYAFTAAPESKKHVMMITGIASLVVIAAGFGLQAKLGYQFSGWLIVKLVCWLGLSALAGMGYRRRGAVVLLGMIALVYAFGTAMIPGWFIPKIVGGLLLLALVGLGYRRRDTPGMFAILALVFVSIAVVMVYTKPF